MAKKMCKHNRMSEVLPRLWIGGTKKHTEIALSLDTYEWQIRRVRVVDTKPSKSESNERYFLCPNYGVPSYHLGWWGTQVAVYTLESRNSLTTVVTDLGGHGRSGLYCAILMAVVLNLTGSEAIARLRQMHCEQAVETAEQEAYVVRIVDELKEYDERNRSA